MLQQKLEMFIENAKNVKVPRNEITFSWDL